MKLGLIDYGAGNLASVERAFARLGAETLRVRTAEELDAAGAIVLPGVGHFAALGRALDRQGLLAPLRDALAAGRAYLGICLGLHALFEWSEEAPDVAGLGALPGVVRSLPTSVKLPHMGWNRVQPCGQSRLLASLDSGAWFYFAHSFAVSAAGAGMVASCNYGTAFAAVVEQDNLFAVQFHPEKSGETGTAVLRTFLEVAR